MAEHEGVNLIPAEHQNAMNVVYALIVGDEPSASQNLGVPFNGTGVPANDPPTQNDPNAYTYYGGAMQLSDALLATLQDVANQIPAASWPVQGVTGPVTLADAQAACAAYVLTVTTRDTLNPDDPQVTLAAALTAHGLKEIVWP
jgi:hypothetical protein